jgi:type IV pilus assembly protein PilV
MHMKALGRMARGFTLLEVLVALIILSIGLLGVGALTLNSMKANDSSAMNTQAAILANSIVDNMRANKAAATTSPSGYAIAIGAPAPTPGSTCAASNCSAAGLAQEDLCTWKSALANAKTLPSGDGGISVVSTGTGPGGDLTTVTVTIVWDDSRAISAFTSSSSSSGSGTAASASPGCGSGSGTTVTTLTNGCPSTIPNCGSLTLETIL